MLFSRLPRKERALVVNAVWLLGAIRLGLWLFPFRFVHGSVERAALRAKQPVAHSRDDTDNIVWAVTAVSRRIPGATCLTQALASRVLLSRAGIPALLRIGVGRSETGAFAAHAWVESNGRIVIGGAESRHRFTTLRPRDSDGNAAK
jgi:hypothetical protein